MLSLVGSEVRRNLMTTTLDTPADVPGFIGLTCSLPGDGASMLTWLCTRTEPR